MTAALDAPTLHLCGSGRHHWSDASDAARCCHGYRRVLDLTPGRLPRRRWTPCDHAGALTLAHPFTTWRCTACQATRPA